MKLRVVAAVLAAALCALPLTGCITVNTPAAPDPAHVQESGTPAPAANVGGQESGLSAARPPAESEAPPVEAARTQPAPAPTESGKQLTEDEVKAIALSHAGVAADKAQFLRVEFDYDDGAPQYEVEFRQGRMEYDYDIHAVTGVILSFEWDD